MFKPSAFAYLEWAAEQLTGYEMLVEFRHRSWLEEGNAAETLSFLERLGATYVMVDAPRSGARNIAPTVVATTSPTAYLRLHGRNAATWNVRGRSAAERFDHLYSEQELSEWVDPLRELTGPRSGCSRCSTTTAAASTRRAAASPRRRSTRSCCASCLERAGVPVALPEPAAG